MYHKGTHIKYLAHSNANNKYAVKQYLATGNANNKYAVNKIKISPALQRGFLFKGFINGNY